MVHTGFHYLRSQNVLSVLFFSFLQRDWIEMIVDDREQEKREGVVIFILAEGTVV